MDYRYSRKVKHEVNDRVSKDFNQITWDAYQQLVPDWEDYVVVPEPEELEISDEIEDFFDNSYFEDIKVGDHIEIDDIRGEVIEIHFHYEEDGEGGYLILKNDDGETTHEFDDVLDEATRLWLEDEVWYTRDELEEHYDDLNAENDYSDIYDVMWGTVFEASDSSLSSMLAERALELYDLNVTVIGETDHFSTVLAVRGAGYDFYDSIWIPLYTEVLNWVKIKTEEEESLDNIDRAMSELENELRYWTNRKNKLAEEDKWDSDIEGIVGRLTDSISYLKYIKRFNENHLLEKFKTEPKYTGW